MGVVFIAKTTCFGPCTRPSSGLELCLRGDTFRDLMMAQCKCRNM